MKKNSQIIVLLFDFSWVLAFPYSAEIGSSAAYKKAKTENQPWRKYLTLNQELINFVHQTRAKYPSYIFSASSKKMLEEMRTHLIPPFIKIFSSKELGLYKYRSESYERIAKILDTAPEQILFIDDSESNIQAARKAGMQTIRFLNNQDFIKKASNLL
jgi:HAD superfamily hydrolase (TIGR01509 family)